ncbi:Sec23/Sec24 trunk domain-containing protein [Choanephora cucurbitarum]|nr:Sec23/Sec24 trunk domain-containing protein [Choanephora cucurbitarum]
MERAHHQESCFVQPSLSITESKLDVDKFSRRLDVALLGSAPMIDDLHSPCVTAAMTVSDQSQCHPGFQRCTLSAIPSSHHLLKRSKLPLSVLIEPYPRQLPVHVPYIEDGLINRCRDCRSFINPFSRFIEGGLKWQCNLCGLDDNDVPPAYDWNHLTQQKMNRWDRAELNYGCVDYMATSEFMSRPPQPPTYIIVIDTSAMAVQTGLIEVLSEALMSTLDEIPNKDGRTRIGFVTASDAIGFYSFANKEPELLMVSDMDDIFLPRSSSDLIVNLNESRLIVLDLLNRLQMMFRKSLSIDNRNCLGSALLAARQLLSSTGGKIICLQAISPNYGNGALLPSRTHRQNTTSDSTLLNPANEFYKAFSEECVRSHVCVDMFVFGSQDIDVATLNVLPKYTGGQTHYYPGFNAKNPCDREKFKQEIEKLMKEQIGLEAIVRTRCSPGLVCSAYYGNFSFQEPDILVLPNVSRDGSFCMDLMIDRDIQEEFVSIQTCMLLTTSEGERIIRVMTTCLPVTKYVTELFYSADQFSIARSLAYQALERASTRKIKDGKDYLTRRTVDICRSYSKEVIGLLPQKSMQLNVCRSLNLLPAMILAILKTEAFNFTGIVPANMSNQSGILLWTLPYRLWLRYVYPSFYSLHNMPIQAGTLDTNHQTVMPPRLNLSSERLDHHGCYLLENGQRIFLWIGREAVPQLCIDLLGLSSINHVMSGQLTSLPILNNPFSERVRRIVESVRTDQRHSNFYPSLYIIKEDGDPLLCHLFMMHLIENRHQLTDGLSKKTIDFSSISYFEWLHFIKEQM